MTDASVALIIVGCLVMLAAIGVLAWVFYPERPPGRHRPGRRAAARRRHPAYRLTSPAGPWPLPDDAAVRAAGAVELTEREIDTIAALEAAFTRQESS